ncbi:MAG: hypothetical protein Ct9H300mP32_5930 [Verrucomicrobiota bacterium]|nr:MAG: hypothetical protein Ct9H300mP32_5930 [Verrucomicrobiota bacterium]
MRFSNVRLPGSFDHRAAARRDDHPLQALALFNNEFILNKGPGRWQTGYECLRKADSTSR